MNGQPCDHDARSSRQDALKASRRSGSGSPFSACRPAARLRAFAFIPEGRVRNGENEETRKDSFAQSICSMLGLRCGCSLGRKDPGTLEVVRVLVKKKGKSISRPSEKETE